MGCRQAPESVVPLLSRKLEVSFDDGTTERALIGVARLGADDVALYTYSLNVAIDVKTPTIVELFRAKTDAWPGLMSDSESELLHARAVDLPWGDDDGGGGGGGRVPDALPGVVRVGRGWLGAAAKGEEVALIERCFSADDCADVAVALRWRGAFGPNVSYSVTAGAEDAARSTAAWTALFVPLVRDEDGSAHNATVFAQRFDDEDDNRTDAALLDAPRSAASPPAADATFGARFWLPAAENAHLGEGTYTAATDAASASYVLAVGADGAAPLFCEAALAVAFAIKDATETVALSDDGAAWTSAASFNATASSLYFLAIDDAVGPTVREWWGGVSATMHVTLYVSCGVDDFDDVEGLAVVATFVAQQTACGSTWQMNAGRGAGECDHQLVLSLDADVDEANDSNANTVNDWLTDTRFVGCEFRSHAQDPVVIEARRWHAPEARELLGELVLVFSVSRSAG